MTTIHMETEQIRNLARQLDQYAANLSSHGSSLRRTSSRISMAWQSGRADAFNNRFHSWLQSYERQVQELENLARRVSREVDEWECTDRAGIRGPSWLRSGILPRSGYGIGVIGAGGLAGLGGISQINQGVGSMTPADQGSKEPSWWAQHLTWGVEGGAEGSASKYTKQKDWHREGISYGAEAKIGVGDAYYQGKYQSLLKWEAGAKAGVGKDGFSAGLYAEGSVYEAERSKVFGSSMFGFTMTGGVSAGSVNGFAGIKDNSVGASIGGSLVGGEIGLGFNILGTNIRLKGGAEAGLEAGVKVGADTEAKLGPFMLGLSFGKALVE